jgi:protein-S-isoprenylcysteine O-methyltransferase
MGMESALSALAALALLLHLLAEPLMRRGRARSLRTTRDEKGTTALVSGVGLAVVAGSVTVRVAGLVLPPTVGLGSGLFLLSLSLVGTGLRFWAMRTLGEFFTRTLVVHDDQRLVSSGPYRAVRHPGYLAHLLAIPSASALLSGSLSIGAAALIVLGAVYSRRIRLEEAMLVASLGDEYEVYRQRTTKLVPWVC